MNNNDANFTISATDKTKATFDAVEKRFGTLSNKAAESSSKIAGVASWAGYATGIEGVGKAAQATSGALGIMSGSMGLLGGPAGIALAAAAGIYAFVTSTEKSRESIDKLEQGISSAKKRVAELAGNMVKVKQIQLDDEIKLYTKEIEELKKATKGGPGLFGNDEEYWTQIDKINENRRAVNGLTAELAKYDAMAKKGITDPNAEGNAAKEQERLNKQIEAKRQAAAQAATAAIEADRKSATAKFEQLRDSLGDEERLIYNSYYNKLEIVANAERVGAGSQAARSGAV